MEVLRQTESPPASYPPQIGELSAKASEVHRGMLWQRIETYTAVRHTPRTVEWIVLGPGEFVPPLSPATLTSTDLWHDEAWAGVVLPASPCGWRLDDGNYRVRATVGGGTPPHEVLEAYRRLAEYLADTTGKSTNPGAYRQSLDVAGLNRSIERTPNWVARAMQYSGAADLLRPYRRAG